MRSLVAIAALCMVCDVAVAGEFRRVVVDPGLPLDVEIVATTGEGFEVVVPQGRMLLPFDRVWEMEDLSGPEALRRIPWLVTLVADDPLYAVVAAAWADRPDLRVEAPSADALSTCGPDATCLAARLPVDAWRFVVVADAQGDQIVLRSVLAGTATVVQAEAQREPEPLAAAALSVLGLTQDGAAPAALVRALERGPQRAAPATVRPPPPAPAPPAPRPARDKPTAGARVGLAFIPFPGVPSLVRKDWGGFALALGTTAAATAGWVGVTGATTTSRGEWIGLSAAGAYVLSVASSELFAHVDLRKHRLAITALPVVVDHRLGGVSVGVTVVPATVVPVR